jgi:hypothetical protein
MSFFFILLEIGFGLRLGVYSLIKLGFGVRDRVKKMLMPFFILTRKIV